MLFFEQLTDKGDAIAAIEGDLQLSYAQLAEQCRQFASQLGNRRQLIFVKAHNNIATLVAYLSGLISHHPMLLIDPAISDDKLTGLMAAFKPNLLVENRGVTQLSDQPLSLDDELALLLSTSGSTGSAKQVALSANNLHANGVAICEYLPILSSDKTITTLPFFYSYGLSVINSHLLAGACIVFNQHGMVTREFWQMFNQHGIASFAGVPHSFDMLLKLRFTRMDLPSLRYFTQAGGKLAAEQVIALAEYAKQQNKQFFVMYGQTEATARMAYLAPDKLLSKPDAIGRAIPGGELSLRDQQGKLITTAGIAGELCYRGPNVMLGYAESAKQLGEFTAPDYLQTGDLAIRDTDGDYRICGRKKRVVKLLGQRINQDEVEQLLASQLGLVAGCCGDDQHLNIVLEKQHGTEQSLAINELKMAISQMLKLHHSLVQLRVVDKLPVGSNGKKDYRIMMTLFAGYPHHD